MKNYLSELSVLLKKYIELSVEELRLGQTQMFVNLLAGLMAFSLIGVILFIIVILLTLSLCLFLADLFESLPLGLLGGAGILAIFFIILQAFNYRLLLRPIKNMIVNIISED
ncbi:MAG TPA: hypothetical protein VJ951_11645 [Bacteroidales bacterium]|nr:hypothetical protein [Bacteroidales bacterium]